MEEENMWETPLLVLSFFLFVFEIFLGMTTLLVSLGARSLPYKDMVGLRNFVVFAGLTITTSSMVVPSDLWVVETLLAAHHFYLYITWDVSDYSKKVLWWSSLNYTKSRSKEWSLRIMALVIISVHGYHAYLLLLAHKIRDITMGIVVAHCMVMSVIYNSRLAWASPSNIPPWIAKRVADSVQPIEQKSKKPKRKLR